MTVTGCPALPKDVHERVRLALGDKVVEVLGRVDGDRGILMYSLNVKPPAFLAGFFPLILSQMDSLGQLASWRSTLPYPEQQHWETNQEKIQHFTSLEKTSLMKDSHL